MMKSPTGSVQLECCFSPPSGRIEAILSTDPAGCRETNLDIRPNHVGAFSLHLFNNHGRMLDND